MRLTDYTNGRIASGQILFRDGAGQEIDLARASEERMRAIRGNDIAMIFQEPMTSLNPVFTVGDQIIEAIMLHQQLSRGAARKPRARCWKSAPARRRGIAGPLSAPAVRRHASARDDRHGPVLPAAPVDRRRADHRAGRHHPGADPEHRARPAARPGHRRDLHHPRHGRGGRDGRRRGGDAARQEGRTGHGGRDLPRAQAPLYPRPAGRRAAPGQPDRPRPAAAHAADRAGGRRAARSGRDPRPGHRPLRRAGAARGKADHAL